jgi:hypothetical protein
LLEERGGKIIMGARYLKIEDTVIEVHYPTAPRAEILELIPNRTWAQIGVHARKKGIHRTSKAWGNSIREGRKTLRDTWSDEDNKKLDSLYPNATHAQLLAAFPSRVLTAIRDRAQRRGLHRTREATGRQIQIGRKEAKRKKR